MAFTPAGGPQTLHKGPKDEEGVCGGGEREREVLFGFCSSGLNIGLNRIKHSFYYYYLCINIFHNKHRRQNKAIR